MATKKQAPTKTNATFLVDVEALERLGALAERMSERAGGAEVSRNAAFRAVMARGLDALEAELGLAKRKK